jgi:hypothetical protein
VHFCQNNLFRNYSKFYFAIQQKLNSKNVSHNFTAILQSCNPSYWEVGIWGCNKAKGRPALHKVKKSVLKIYFFQIRHIQCQRTSTWPLLTLPLFSHKNHTKNMSPGCSSWWSPCGGGLVWGLAGATPPLQGWHHAGRVGDRASRPIEGQVALPVSWAVSRPLAPMKPPRVWRPRSQWQLQKTSSKKNGYILCIFSATQVTMNFWQFSINYLKNQRQWNFCVLEDVSVSRHHTAVEPQN